jgi:uncharacterized protein (DUF1800 family)
MNRNEFFKEVLANRRNKTKSYSIENDEIFKKFSNKELPIHYKLTRASGLDLYTGVWGEKQKTHLLRRTLFGVTQDKFDQINTMTLSQAVDALVDAPSVNPLPPVNYYESFFADPAGIPLGDTWVNAPYDPVGTANYYRFLSLQAWWVQNIIDQGLNIEEKMILFWHNHFATIYNDVGESRFLYKYLDLLRKHATGNFKTFVKEMTKDGMMLIFLNGLYNNKSAPDENYARELQELFTLGKENSSYTEDDVKQAAKVLTGHRTSYYDTNYSFDASAHDESNKQFSSFYGSRVIQGRAGADGENELDDLLDMIFTKKVIIATYICKKLYRFFVHYSVHPTIENELIGGLAYTFMSNNWEIKPVLKQLLKSTHFFDMNSTDCLIKNPMDYYIGLVKTSYVKMPDKSDILHNHQANIMVYYILYNLAMEPANPPSVAGWAAYHQTPQFHQIWINSNTLPNRLLYTDYLFTDYGVYASADVQFKSDVIEFAKQCSLPSDPNVLINFFIMRLLSFGLSVNSMANLKTILLGGLPNDFYWSNAWVNYITFPDNQLYEGVVRSRLQNLLTQLARQAEQQIA